MRGRTTTAESAEGAQFLSARGAKPKAHHGPLQRLLEDATTSVLCPGATVLRKPKRPREVNKATVRARSPQRRPELPTDRKPPTSTEAAAVTERRHKRQNHCRAAPARARTSEHVDRSVFGLYSADRCSSLRNEILLRPLTVKLRGRAEAPDDAEGAQFLSARGAKPQAHHGPLQRLLEARSCLHSRYEQTEYTSASPHQSPNTIARTE